MKIIASILFLSLLISCGGGSGSGDGAEEQGSDSDNGAAAPGADEAPLDVTGEYAFIANPGWLLCPLGLSGLVTFKQFNFTVTQTGGKITIQSDAEPAQGETITLPSVTIGTVDQEGNFSATASGTLSYDNIFLGSANFTATIEGAFATTGWTGDFTETISFQTFGVECKLTTKAWGDKLS